MKIHAYAIPIFFSLALLCGALFARDIFPLSAASYQPPAITAASPFEKLAITGKAVYVLDIPSGRVLYAKNAEAQLPLASVTKLMTAWVASRTLGGNSLVAITDEALGEEGESYLHKGETFSLSQLLDFTLVTSSNDGAAAIAGAAGAGVLSEDEESARARFVAAMNKSAADFGLSQTYFTNPTGLDYSENTAGAYGSARDMALFIAQAYEKDPHLFEATRALKENLAPGEAENTNERVGDIPGLLLSKTGFTDLAGGNLAVVFDAGLGHPVAVVVLGSTREGRFDDVEALSGEARKLIAKYGVW